MINEFVLVRKNQMGNNMILCINGDFHSARDVDKRVGLTARRWKSEAGAKRYAADRWNSVSGRTNHKGHVFPETVSVMASRDAFTKS